MSRTYKSHLASSCYSCRRMNQRSTTAPLDIKASVGTSTSPTTTGTKAVTGVGFEPKAVIELAAPLISGSTDVSAILNFGATDGTTQAAISCNSRHSLSTTNTNRRHTNARQVTYLSDSGSTLREEASFSSFDADGFTRNWTLAQASAWIYPHIALGGDDFERSITLCQMNNTNAAQSFAHGLSGAPTGVLFVSTLDTASLPVTSTFIYFSMGAWADGSQFDAALFSWNAVTTSSTRRRLSSVGVATLLAPNVSRQMAVSSVDATNVNVTYPSSSSSAQYRFSMIAIRGAKCKVGTFDCNGSTNPLIIDCAGITPKLWLGIGVPGGVDNVGAVQNDARLSIMASDGTNNVSCGITDANGVTTTNARRWQDSNSLAEYNTSGTLEFDAAVTFSGESAVLDPTTCSNSTIGQGFYIIIGA